MSEGSVRQAAVYGEVRGSLALQYFPALGLRAAQLYSLVLKPRGNTQAACGLLLSGVFRCVSWSCLIAQILGFICFEMEILFLLFL